jgi:DNA repair exonuclease SbcCD ATPase subunit
MAEQDYTAATPTPKTATRPVPGTGTSPEEELKKLKEAWEKDQQEAEKLKKKMDDGQAKIKALEKAVAETNQVTGAFAATMQAIATERLEIKDFLANELPQMEKLEEVKNRKAEIETKIKDIDTAIETKAGEVQTLEQKARDESAALQTATGDQAAKKQELDALKDRHRIIQDKVGKVRKLRQRMATEGANKPLLKYVLALEVQRIWDETTPFFQTPDQLEAAFIAKADEVKAAAAAVAAQGGKAKAAQSELQAAQKDFEARRNGRLDEIVKQVGELAPKAQAAAAGAGAGAAARTAP